MQSYSLIAALRERGKSHDEVSNLLERISGGIINTYEADKDFDDIFGAIASEAGVAATGNLFRMFVVPEKVAEWEAEYIKENPEAMNDKLIKLEPMQSPAEYRRNRGVENV